MTGEKFVAAILAGGEGRRIGGGKANVILAGKPLAAHVARALGDVVALAVVGDEKAADLLSAVHLSDPAGFPRGPLTGVLSGLEWACREGAQWLAVAPCDTPLLPRDIVARLRGAVGAAPLVCAQTDIGVEPLISLWRCDMLAQTRAALASNHPPMREFIRNAGAVYLHLALKEAMNVNAREDLARAEFLLARS